MLGVKSPSTTSGWRDAKYGVGIDSESSKRWKPSGSSIQGRSKTSKNWKNEWDARSHRSWRSGTAGSPHKRTQPTIGTGSTWCNRGSNRVYHLVKIGKIGKIGSDRLRSVASLPRSATARFARSPRAEQRGGGKRKRRKGGDRGREECVVCRFFK